MEAFTTLTGVAAPLPMANVDTDMIIPKAHCKRPGRTGFGRHLFNDIRYFPDGRERPDFVLNRPPYRDAAILISGANFGCGSSREAAVWALREFGIRCILAPSFADIFAGNCFQNGVLPLTLPEDRIAALSDMAAGPDPFMTVDLERERMTVPGGATFDFTVDPYRRDCLLKGLDEIGVTLTHEAEIAAYEARVQREERWRLPSRGD